MYIQAKRDPDQQWFSTNYRLTEQDVSLIINDREEEWKTPVLETMQKETQQQEKDQEEYREHEEQGNGAGDTQETTPPTGEKRKENPKELLTHKHKNRKASKEVDI
jgi:hypothetical protein